MLVSGGEGEGRKKRKKERKEERKGRKEGRKEERKKGRKERRGKKRKKKKQKKTKKRKEKKKNQKITPLPLSPFLPPDIQLSLISVALVVVGGVCGALIFFLLDLFLRDAKQKYEYLWVLGAGSCLLFALPILSFYGEMVTGEKVCLLLI